MKLLNMNANLLIEVFEQSIKDYHVSDHVDTALSNPYPLEDIRNLLYHKNWIDTIQWHLEDLIRDQKLGGEQIIALKRRIDASNQHRTDLVEKIDDWFMNHIKAGTILSNAKMNSETPAWLLDRISILMLKIYHMEEQTQRTDVSKDHIDKCSFKLNILLEQKDDLCQCFDELTEDIKSGRKYMKVYRQMKMYNDETLNPVLYAAKKG